MPRNRRPRRNRPRITPDNSWRTSPPPYRLSDRPPTDSLNNPPHRNNLFSSHSTLTTHLPRCFQNLPTARRTATTLVYSRLQSDLRFVNLSFWLPRRSRTLLLNSLTLLRWPQALSRYRLPTITQTTSHIPISTHTAAAPDSRLIQMNFNPLHLLPTQ